jgi:hypothetical protein
VSLDEAANRLSEFLKKYKYPVCYIEINYESYIYELLIQRNVSNITRFRTTTPSKKKMIDNLILKFQNKEISLSKYKLDNIIKNELSSFTYTYNPKTNNISFHARGTNHDDFVISLALSFWSLNIGNVSWS